MTEPSPVVIKPPQATEVPLLVSIPHTGTYVPDAIARRFSSTEVAALPDTDWHLHVLYDFVASMGAWTIHAHYSRFVVDLNRPADGTPLYPGRDETGLVPSSTFHSVPIYKAGQEPTRDEIAERTAKYWRPYHDALSSKIAELKAKFGYALLWDAHSIESNVPRFHKGQLPGLMLGDVDGTSAVPAISDAVLKVHVESGITYQRNSPFKGGYITRAFGKPQERVQALQLEMSQRLYMQEGAPFAFNAILADQLRPTLRASLQAFLDSARIHHAR